MITRCQRRVISKHFNTERNGTTGYVLDFSDKAFAQFALDTIGREFTREADGVRLSKWKALDRFIMDMNTPDEELHKVIGALLDHEELINGKTAETTRLRDMLHAADADKLDAVEENIVGRIEEIGAKLDDTQAIILAHFPNRQADCQVTQEELAGLLEKKNCPICKRTVQRWEKYLKTSGKEGIRPPAGYSLQTRLTLQQATAWVCSYTAAENGKLNTKISFEARFGGRT